MFYRKKMSSADSSSIIDLFLRKKILLLFWIRRMQPFCLCVIAAACWGLSNTQLHRILQETFCRRCKWQMETKWSGLWVVSWCPPVSYINAIEPIFTLEVLNHNSLLSVCQLWTHLGWQLFFAPFLVIDSVDSIPLCYSVHICFMPW